jgi:carbon storage regulator
MKRNGEFLLEIGHKRDFRSPDGLRTVDARIHERTRTTFMLILTRRIGETLTIGPDVRITVLAQRNNPVTLGIRAPMHIAVHRQEVFDRIQQERAAPDCVADAGGARTSINSK